MKKLLILIMIILVGCTPNSSFIYSTINSSNIILSKEPTHPETILSNAPIPFDENYMNIYEEGQQVYILNYFYMTGDIFSIVPMRFNDLYPITYITNPNFNDLNYDYVLDVVFDEKYENIVDIDKLEVLDVLEIMYNLIEENSIVFNSVALIFGYQKYYELSVKYDKFADVLMAYLDFLEKLKNDKKCIIITLERSALADYLIDENNISYIRKILSSSSYTIFYVDNFGDRSKDKKEKIDELMNSLKNDGFSLFYEYDDYSITSKYSIRSLSLIDIVLNGRV